LEFLRWFKNIDMPDSQPQIIVGDFNLIGGLKIEIRQEETIA
jgi:hypothetical protein